MKRISALFSFLELAMLFIYPALIPAQELKQIQLPNPQIEGGRPLMETLNKRESSRAFSTKKIPLETLSNLLWAACGINRQDSGKRTAPSAVNWQNIDIYVAIQEGVYVYDAKANALNPILARDFRAMTGTQPFVKDAPLNLIYVGDFSKTNRSISDDEKNFYSAAHTGFISQNVYLFCASEGLATVVRGLVDRQALAKSLKLRPDQKVTFAQTVGYPN